MNPRPDLPPPGRCEARIPHTDEKEFVMPINRWTHRLELGDVFHDESKTFEQRRDVIVARIKAARFYDSDDNTLDDIVWGLVEARNIEEFDGWWSEFYDYADSARIWVETISSPKERVQS